MISVNIESLGARCHQSYIKEKKQSIKGNDYNYVKATLESSQETPGESFINKQLLVECLLCTSTTVNHGIEVEETHMCQAKTVHKVY